MSDQTLYSPNPTPPEHIISNSLSRRIRQVCSYLPLITATTGLTAAITPGVYALDSLLLVHPPTSSSESLSRLNQDPIRPLGSSSTSDLDGNSQESLSATINENILADIIQGSLKKAILPESKLPLTTGSLTSSPVLSAYPQLASSSQISSPSFKVIDRRQAGTDDLATLVTKSTTAVLAALPTGDMSLGMGGTWEETSGMQPVDISLEESTPATATDLSPAAADLLAIAPEEPVEDTSSAIAYAPQQSDPNSRVQFTGSRRGVPVPFGRSYQRQNHQSRPVSTRTAATSIPANSIPTTPVVSPRPSTVTVSPVTPRPNPAPATAPAIPQPMAAPVPVKVARQVISPQLPDLDLPPLPASDRYLPSPITNQFVWPAQGVFTSGFGPRWGRIHRGIDIAGPVGTPVVAAASGVVTFSGWNSGGFGNLVEIRHTDGTLTLYAHNHRNIVRQGQYVQQGEQIALMGSTGRSTGPHVHFEIHPQGRGAVNPMNFLRRSQG
ncbi:M23 family metallopeptidase [Candidatus Synechococcus calcipolaris]|uniref:M23 family metallopeptidase n=1 Tax=Candidatus Synechococcus calcipolaris TaxID=1522304 RepID=UPI0030CA21F8